MITIEEINNSKKKIKGISKQDKSKFIRRYKNLELFKNLEEDDVFWMIMLFYLVWMQENENEKLWKEFVTEIKYKSRFFPKCKLLKKVDKISAYASVELSKGTILYRAREYKKSDLLHNKEIIALYDKLNKMLPDLKLELEDMGSESAMNIVLLLLGGDIKKYNKLKKEIKKIINKKEPFWGFNEKDSDAPPKEYANAGRANSVGISYLYAATDKKTAIMEMRPQIGQNYNICKIEICKNIRIFDLTYSTGKLDNEEYSKAEDLYAISKQFSLPNYGSDNDYIPTQYLCEYIKNKGFDGIRYKSAVLPDGINLIIFDTDSKKKPYKIVESQVFGVTNLDIRFEQVLPFEL